MFSVYKNKTFIKMVDNLEAAIHEMEIRKAEIRPLGKSSNKEWLGRLLERSPDKYMSPEDETFVFYTSKSGNTLTYEVMGARVGTDDEITHLYLYNNSLLINNQETGFWGERNLCQKIDLDELDMRTLEVLRGEFEENVMMRKEKPPTGEKRTFRL